MTTEERVRQALRRWRDQEPEAVSLGHGMGTLWAAMTEAMDTACAAAVAAVTETAITAMEQADAVLVEINPWNYDAVDVARQHESVIEASRLLREAIGALRAARAGEEG